MSSFAPFAYWLLRRLTGYRLYHLVGLVAVVITALCALAVPFWLLAEQAASLDGLAGVAGVGIVSIAYLCAAASMLVAFTILVGGLTVRRIRNVALAGMSAYPRAGGPRPWQPQGQTRLTR